MEPADRIALQLGARIRTELLVVARRLSLAVKDNPALGPSVVTLYDNMIAGVLRTCQIAAEDAVNEAWQAHGTSATREQLLADVARAYASAPAGLSQAVAAATAEEERASAVRRAVLDFAAALALRNKLSVTAAAGFSTTESTIAQAQLRADAGEDVELEWVASHDGKDPRSCWWCRSLHGQRVQPGEEFPHPAQHGNRKPPRLYTGHLFGPLLHPRCRCKLRITSSAAGAGSPQAQPHGAGTPEPADFISSDTIRAMPEAEYSKLHHFLSSALHELGQVLRRLAHPYG